VNVALPSLVRQLHASTTNLQWVVDAYSLVFAALILTAGSLGDRLGRKGTLIVGLGAALIFPATLSLLSNVFTERAERGQSDRAVGRHDGRGDRDGTNRRRLAP
jgi:MFS family permease